jgi:hypothetical protein
VEVHWHDSSSLGRWRTRADHMAVAATEECRSVGYVTKRGRDSLTLAQTHSQGDDVLDAISIPRGCIRRVRRLR